jgi:hypothetical protein
MLTTPLRPSGTGAGHVEDAQAAEAVADGGDAGGVDGGVVLGGLERGEQAAAELRPVADEGHHQGGVVAGEVAHLAVAVDVEREADVAEGGHLVGLGVHALVAAGPVVGDDHAGERARALGHGHVAWQAASASM